MKKFLLFSIALLLSICTMGQSTANYAFTTNTTGSLVLDMNANTVDMSTGTTQLVGPSSDATVSPVTSIGFNFILMGNIYTQFSASADGLVGLGSTATSGTTISGGSAASPKIAAMGGDLYVGSTGKVHYKLIGTSPNRCLVVEFLNMAVFYNTAVESNIDNWQVRLYESPGVIEFVYGRMYCGNSSWGPGTVGFTVGTATNTIASVTTATNAVDLTTVNTNAYTIGLDIPNLNSTIDGSRRSYRFTPPVAPPMPGGPIVFAPVSYTSMTLTWTDIAGENGYVVYRSDDNGTTYNYIASTAANVVTYAASGLVIGKTYYWKVYSFNEGRLSSSLDGIQATLPAGEKISTGTGLWSAVGTWSPSGVPASSDNVTILDGHTVTIDIAATCNNLTVGAGASGVLQYEATTARALTVGGNVTVAANGTFQTAISGTVVTHALSVAGNLVVNGTFDMNVGTAGTAVTFTGSADASISGSGATCDFYSITVNKGSSLTPVLDVTRLITSGSPSASGTRLTITNGTFKLSSASTLTPYYGPATICTSTGRLWLNNSSASIAVVGIGTIASGGNPTISGELRIDNGTFGYGSGSNTAIFTSGSGILRMSGGTFNMYGAISFPSSATTQFIMSGGNINVDPQVGTTYLVTTPIFSIGASTTVNWSGGFVTIIDPHNATAGVAWSATSGGSKTITGGTLRLGDGISNSAGGAGGATANTDGFGFFSSMPVWNLEINSMLTVNSRMVRLSSSTASVVQNNLTVNSGGYLFLGSGTTGSELIFRGNPVNNGTIAGCEPAGTQSIGTLRFQGQLGSGAQILSGAGSITNLATLNVENYGTGASSSLAFKVRRINLFTGTLDPTNITIGNPSGLTLEQPIVQMGSGSSTLASGTFSVAPTYDESEGQRTLLYSIMLGAPIMGIYNEIGTGASTLTQLYVNDGDGLTIPADRTITIGGTIAGTLSMVLGNINLSGGTLTLGNAALTPGTLTWTAGLIINGTFNRWFPATGLPTAVGTSIGYFPMGVLIGGITTNRQIKIAFSAATITTGGTIAASVVQSPGLTTGLTVPDGAYTINRRTNSSWSLLSANGLNLGTTTGILQLQGTNAIATTTTGLPNLRAMLANSVVGTYSTATGTIADPLVNRTALSLADLNNTFYIGAADADLYNIIFSAQTGNWNQTTTWQGGVIPTSADVVVILNTHAVSVTDAEVALTVAINSGGTLNVNTGGNLVVTGAATTGIINNAGAQFNVNGGTVTLGPANGGNRTFSNSGNLTVSSGILNINGNFTNISSTGNVFTQSGGNINVDGNAGGVAANSVATGTYLVNFSTGTPTTILLTGGTFTIVDPHYSTSYALNGSMSSSTNCGSGHTFRFGDGVSTDPGGSNGFYVYLYPGSGYFVLGNVIVNGGSGLNRFVNTTSSVGILGNLTINNGGEYRVASTNYTANNVTVNAGGILTTTSTLYMGSFASGTVAPTANAQTISGAGTFRNSVPTAAVSAGGTGYVVGDILTVVGGTYTSVATFIVSAVTGGVVTGVVSSGYANYSVLPAVPAATTGGTGTGCTLTTLTNFSPTANMVSLTVNNSNATGVMIGIPLSISGTLTLTLGIVNTTYTKTTNLLTLGTATAAGTLSGGSATAYIVGPFARTFAASRTATGTYTATTLYPVGKGISYLPLWIDPTTTSVGAVILSGEAFTTNTGTGASGVSNLSQHRWQALITSGLANFTNTYIKFADASIVTGNQILHANSADGVYGPIPVPSVFTTGTPNTLNTNSPILAAAYKGYFAYGDLIACTAPTAQPSALVTTYMTSTRFTGTFTAASPTPPEPAPSNYLVVRYPTGITPTAPSDYTLYAIGDLLGTSPNQGTVRSISGATTWNETGLTASTGYDYYFYSYNNNACYGPIYNLTLPYMATVTTCALIGVPGTPTSSLLQPTSMTVSWTASITAGVSYILDVATNSTFTTPVPGYQLLNVGVGTLSWPVTGLTANTPYYVRVMAYDGVLCYSEYSSTLTVPTPCDPIASGSLPWSENFDAMPTIGNNILPDCWRATSPAGTPWSSGNAASISYNDPCSAPNYVYVNWSPSASDKFLITPGFTLTAGTPYDFKFKWIGDGYAGWNGDVFCNSYPSGTGATQLGTSFVVAATTTTAICTQEKRTFTPATTGTYYFMVRVNNPTSAPYDLGFDDFSLNVSVPEITVVPTSLDFGYTPSGATSIEKSYLLTGQLLTYPGNITIMPPSNFEVGTTTGGPYSKVPITVGINSDGTISATIFVVFKPTSPNTPYSGNIVNSGGSAAAQNVAVTGTSVVTYCTPTYLSGGANDFITQVTLGLLSQATASNVSPYYINYTSTQNAVPDLALGSSNSLSLTFGTDATQYNGVWIDFNQDGTLATTEFFTSGTNAGSGGTAIVNLTIPPTASLGNTRMRIRGGEDSQVTSGQACGASSSPYGQAQDYLVNIIVPLTPVLSALPLSLDFGYVPVGGTSAYQSYALTGLNLTPNGSVTVTPPTGFIICATSGGIYGSTPLVISYAGTTISTTVYVKFSPIALVSYSDNITNVAGTASTNVLVTGITTLVYCAAGATVCDEYISRVQLNTIDNSTACTSGGYADYTAISTTLSMGSGSLITITNGTPYSSDQCGIWIDWNNNGSFYDAGEAVTVTGSPGGGPYTATITPPVGAVQTGVRMRIRICYNAAPDPCGTTYYGEVEDYSIMIAPPLALDAATLSIDNVPTANAPGVILTPKATVKNVGTTGPVTFDVTITATDGYTSTVSSGPLASGAQTQVTFANWTPANGIWTATVCTQLAGDGNTSNDCKSKVIVVKDLNKQVYAYNAYRGTGPGPEGPTTFNLSTPGTLNSLANQSTLDFVNGGTWANGIWYGEAVNSVSGFSELVTLDPVTGARTLIGSLGVAVNDISYNPVNNTMYAVIGSSLYTVDMTTGSATLVGGSTPGIDYYNIAIDAAGQAYGIDGTGATLGTINLATGAYTVIGSLGYTTYYAQGMEFDRATGDLYISAEDGSGGAASGWLALANKTTGAAIKLGDFEGGAEITGFAIPYVLTKTLNLKVYLEGLYDVGTASMRQAMENNAPSTPHFGPGIADQVTVELHNALAPYAIAYTYSNVNLNTDGTASITTIPGTITGSYYIVIKHRNSIETWSMAPVSFAGAGPVFYDFSTAASQAFDNNMKLMGAVYAIYGGNPNQDGIVDGSDLALIDNASTAQLVGYNPEDVNGDGFVDASDMAMVDNNSTAIVEVQKP